MDEKDVMAAGTQIITEVAKERAAAVYDDAFKLAAQETGGAMQAIVGLFNHVVLYPVKMANLTFRYKLEQFEEDLKAKVDRIPPGQVIYPELAIAGPTLEALKYTFDTEELREMYLKLLASSMNSED